MSERKTALITGASGGIGESLARVHAAKGENLLLVARREPELRTLKGELESTYGIEVNILAMDLTELGAVERVAAYLDELDWKVDHLVNNAGFGGQGEYHEVEWSRHASMIRLNVMVLAELTRRLMPGMVERGYGRILNVASTAAFIPGPLQAVYYATKAFVVSLSEALWEEGRRHGVTVTALCPGPVATGFAKEAGVEKMSMFRMAATPDKVAKVGYRGMMRGKRVVSEVGPMVWMARVFGGWIPRRFMLRSIYKMQDV